MLRHLFPPLVCPRGHSQLLCETLLAQALHIPLPGAMQFMAVLKGLLTTQTMFSQATLLIGLLPNQQRRL